MNRAPIPSGGCQEEGGFLFSHACGRPAGAMCTHCGKHICDMHLVASSAGLVCKSCNTERSEDEDETESDSDTDVGEDDPSYYYEGYGYYGPSSPGSQGHDPNDFTEADGESLRHEDDASFEEDLGGS